ncbi:MAG TPA: oxygenase MpaB family protein [Chloroflexota bacterium]|nr:oxygenase MpaB family protein [Chloroflexota bacterium]
MASTEHGLAGPETMAWRINGEIAGLLGWGRAILLQVAHPLVAAGVSEHSQFAHDALGRARRLRRTLGAMLTLTFGSYDEAVAVARHIDGIHGRIRGTLAAPTGTLAAGTPYFARDPDLLRWVHATYVDSALRTYLLYVGPLSRAEQDRYCAETTAIEPLLNIPAGYLPRDVASLTAYLDAMLASGQIAVGEPARRIARELLAPLGPPVLRPLEALLQLPIAGLLPPALRAAYGLPWSRRHARALRASAALTRRLRPYLPAALCRWPQARAAERRVRALRAAESSESLGAAR